MAKKPATNSNGETVEDKSKRTTAKGGGTADNNPPNQNNNDGSQGGWFNRMITRKERRVKLREEKRKAELEWKIKKREVTLKWLELKGGRPQNKEFFLVFWMLVSLTLLVVGIVCFPLLMKELAKKSIGTDGTMVTTINSEFVDKILDYSKWVLSALLAAFGAWIGAGAAYFFGRENLRESSRATEEALRIQQKSLGAQPEEKVFVKDLALTAMNPNFMFNPSDTLGTVLSALEGKLGYWFVPIINAESGILKDVVSTQAFTQFKFHPQPMENEDKSKKLEDLIKSRNESIIEEIIKFLDADDKLKKLHGLNTFFIKISLNDTLESVAAQMKSPNTAVAIVVDAKGKPTHCLTRTDLGTMLKPEG